MKKKGIIIISSAAVLILAAVLVLAFLLQPKPEPVPETSDPVSSAPSEPADTPEEEEPALEELKGDVIKGVLEKEGDCYEYAFTPVNSGVHRFDFDISNVEADYNFIIVGPKNEEILEDTFRHYFYYVDKGVSVPLDADKTYKITVSYESKPCEFEIKIGRPDAVKEVTTNKISGKIGYIDERDVYTYTSPKSGLVRFDFSISDVESYYRFFVKDSKNKEIIDMTNTKGTPVTYRGVTLMFTKGETYTIYVEYKSGLCEYGMDISLPDDTSEVKGDTISGTIRYYEQENTYTFTAPKDGEYKIYFNISDVNSNFDFKICAKNNSIRCKTTYAGAFRAGGKVYTEATLTAGETYTVYVTQKDRLCDYEIKFEPKN